jgi:serine phosphatase RsbU (regulator of sigma subunit)
MAARRARRLARQRRELLDDVGLLQAALLPALPDHVGAVGTSAAYRPASGPAAGGDFYDLFTLSDGRIGVIVGDVSGHGRAALPHTTLVRFTLRAYLEAGLSPRGSLQTAAPVLERQLADSFVTVAVATYDPTERMLTYACAGHPPPLVLGADAPDGDLRALEPVVACSAPPIGTGQPTGTRQTTVSLPGRALVCFYTDGLVEARVRGSLYGVQRLAHALAELPADEGASKLIERVAAETDRHPDDMAACLLGLDGEAKLPRVQLDELELERHENARERAERFLAAVGASALQTGRATAALEGSLCRGGGVVLEAHAHPDGPEVRLRERNVAQLRPQSSGPGMAREATG